MCVVAFAIAEGTLLQRLPWLGADRLVWLGADAKRSDASGFGLVEYDRIVANTGRLATSAPYMLASGAVRMQGGTERIAVTRVGGDFFDVLGIRAAIGRTLNSRDDHPGAELTVVLSEPLWKKLQPELGDPSGKVLVLDDRRLRIVGMLSKAMAFPATTDAWVAIEPAAGSLLRSTNVPFLHAMARVRTAADIAVLRAQLSTIPRSRDQGSAFGGRFVAEPLRDYLMKNVRTAILLLAGASAILLAIACLAAATIQLAGRDRREHELAIRFALGASVSQLSRSVLLDVAGTAVVTAIAGLALSEAALGGARRWGATTVPELLSIHLDWTVVVVATAIASLAALCSFAAPMISVIHSDTAELLRRTGNTASSSAKVVAFRDALTAMSIGVTLILIISFAVAADTLLGLVRVDTGFITRNVVVGSVRLPMPIVTPVEAERIRSFMGAFATSVAERNGGDVAISTDVPGKGNQSFTGVQSTETPSQIQCGMTQVSSNYFSLAGIPLRTGRTFGVPDQRNGPLAAVIDQDLARALYGERSPIGRKISIAALGDEEAEIVGVVGTVRQGGRLAERLPQLYLPIERLPLSSFAVLQRASAPESVFGVWRSAAKAVDPSASVGRVSSLEDAVYGEMRRPKFYAAVLLWFAIAAMFTSGAAVYASVAALVSQRTREIAIRTALGARQGQVAILVLRGVFRMTTIGSLLGIACALGVIRLLELNVGPLGRPTPFTLTASICILWSAAALAVCLPVLRATRISPIAALKD
jgi:putative ABC transport system permease protein